MDFSIDSIDPNRTTNVPGAVPNICPGCRTPFSQVLKPPRKLQAKARLISAVGLLASMVLMPLVYVAIQDLLFGLGMRAIPLLLLGGATLVISAVPGYLLCAWALRSPRVVHMYCRECDWAETFLVDKTGKVVSQGHR